jgi:predicted deacylase
MTFVIGHSAGGRPIEGIHVGGTGPTVLVVGCIHGNECAALPVVARLERLHPAHENLWVISEANPDGTAAGRRVNADGEVSFVVEFAPGPLPQQNVGRHVRAMLDVTR